MINSVRSWRQLEKYKNRVPFTLNVSMENTQSIYFSGHDCTQLIILNYGHRPKHNTAGLVTMDTSSLIIGVTIGVIGAFGTGFLKKAGEDFYSSLKAKINPKSAATVTPQLVVHLHDDRGNNQAESELSAQLAPASIERLSQVNFDDIEKAIEGAPPMQQEHVANSYVGLKIELDSYLRSANKRDNGEIFLRLSIDKNYRGRAVLCKVQAEEYRVLGILPKGARIRVAGEIAKASSCDIELSNVRLQIFPDVTAA